MTTYARSMPIVEAIHSFRRPTRSALNAPKYERKRFQTAKPPLIPAVGVSVTNVYLRGGFRRTYLSAVRDSGNLEYRGEIVRDDTIPNPVLPTGCEP